MKNKEILAYANNLGLLTKNQDELINKDPSTPRYPVKLSFAINKNKRALAEAGKDYQTTFDEITNKYSLEVKDGKINLEKLSEEQRKKFADEVNELLDTDTEVNIHKVEEDAFGTYEPTLAELECLSFMME